jgi:uncharacterized membrane protein SpoIIM required for sporulation
MTQADDLRSVRFRRQREQDWEKLDGLLLRVEKRGVHSLDFIEARSLAALYRQACTSLSVAREISLDRGLLTYLEALTARAYLAVYAPQQTLGGTIARFFARSGPQAFRRSLGFVALGYIGLILGAVAGVLLYTQDVSWYHAFFPGGVMDPRHPGASASELLSVVYDDETPEGGNLAVFASYLFSHNTRIAIFCFGLGVFACLPSFTLCVVNGLGLGVLVALYLEQGLGWDLFGWLSIHGVTELSAIAIAAGAGILLGSAVLFPGPFTRKAALRRVGSDATKLAVIAAMMLIVAALVEGFGRQLIQDTAARLVIGWGIGAGWAWWLLFVGRGPVRGA